jgi:Tfp pilus assembly PilM family ATPase
MNIISIDVGTYSVKILESVSERKNLVHQAVHEVVVEDYKQQIKGQQENEHFANTQLSIIKEFLSRVDYDAKIIFQVPSEITTARFLTLPTNNKKKAELMVPFQLEEDVPFLSNHYHYAVGFDKKSSQMQALATIVQKEKFNELHDKLTDLDCLPHYLTDEISLFQNYAQLADAEENYAILDLGHRQSKCYFVKDRRIVSTHSSFVGGHLINQVISQTYNISMQETIVYKHQNAFFLTPQQKDQVDKDQLEFAQMMDRAVKDLIMDLKRWIIGFKVGHSESVQKLYICGGSSNIKNIKSYLSHHLGVSVNHFSPYELVNFGKFELDKKQKTSFILSHLGGLTLNQKLPPLNFLNGAYATNNYEDLPLHSATFIGMRVTIVVMILMGFFALERLQLNKENKRVDKKLTKVLKDESLGFSVLQRRKVKKTPQVGVKKLKTRVQSIRQEITTIQSASEIDSITPLAKVSSLALPGETYLQRFEASAGKAFATFESTESTQLQELKTSLENLGLEQQKIDVTDNELQLSFSY